MNILFIGDSITSGKLGTGYVTQVAQNMPGLQITNLGIDGQTFSVICNRLSAHLKVVNNYDYIVLQGGYNDILLPSFLGKGFFFNRAYKNQLKNGLIPSSDPGQFQALLHSAIRSTKQNFKGKIIILTIGCVGEELHSALNLQRNKLNAIIRTVASEEKIILADTQIHFDNILKENVSSAYCLDSFWAVTFWDRLKKTPDNISKARKLSLTIDGVHLNSRGAAIFANCILNEINKPA